MIPVIIQARMSSERCRGKVLRKLGDYSLLEWTIKQLQELPQLNPIIVATSKELSDQPIEDFCLKNGIMHYRGSLKDVAGRYLEIVDYLQCHSFVRICGDSPFIDPVIIGRAINLFITDQADVVTNIFPKTFPKGMSVEIINTRAFRQMTYDIVLEEHKEHCTKYFYENPDQFRIINFTADENYSDVQLSVDTEADFEKCEKMIKEFKLQPGDVHWKPLVQQSIEKGFITVES